MTTAGQCERCAKRNPPESRPAAGICCSSHNKALCHLCYRRTHFVELCVEGCPDCAAEDLPVGLKAGSR